MQSKAYEGFGILDLDGQLSCQQRSIPEPVTNMATRPGSRMSCVIKKWSWGQYHGEHINGEPVLYVAIPALNNRRQIVAVAFAALNLNWMNRTIFKQLSELPEGSRLTLLDKPKACSGTM
jgi:hypothetical protein